MAEKKLMEGCTKVLRSFPKVNMPDHLSISDSYPPLAKSRFEIFVHAGWKRVARARGYVSMATSILMGTYDERDLARGWIAEGVR